MKLKKIICLLLAVSIICLTGCGANKAAEAVAVAQEEMNDTELKNTIDRIEYMALLSAIDSNKLVSGYPEPAYIGDADGDGELELFYGDYRYVIFEKGNNNMLYYQWTQGGGFVVDANGLCYCTDTMGGPEFDNHDNEIGWGGHTYYDRWNGTEHEVAYTERFIDYYNESKADEVNWYSYQETEVPMTTEEADALGFHYGNEPREYTSYSFEARYRDHVVQALQDSLSSTYSCYTSAQMDIDGDGSEETLISIPEIFNPWLQNVTGNDIEFQDPLANIKETVADIESGYTAFLVISTKDNTTTVSTCAIPENVYESVEYVDFHTNYFNLGGYTVYAPVAAVDFASLSDDNRRGVLSALNTYFELFDHYIVVYKIADVSDLPGDEILCFSEEDDGLFVDIISLSDGAINLIEKKYIDNLSFYLVVHEGKTHILTYYQYFAAGVNPTYYYNYDLYRYGTNNMRMCIDADAIEYAASQSDATSVSSFFTALNVYLEGDITVLHDTYALMGQEWMNENDIDYGERPTSDDALAEEGTLGFVKVYADTWLNLRVGPGTQYDRVLLDPNNPQSFVKQALGSPVTILEEIETGDPDNPVWVRIRIVYQNQVLEGYSSKRYIKVAG